MDDIRVLSVQQASQKGVRLLREAVRRMDSAVTRYGWQSRAAAVCSKRQNEFEKLLGRLSSDDPRAVSDACYVLTIMGDVETVYDG